MSGCGHILAPMCGCAPVPAIAPQTAAPFAPAPTVPPPASAPVAPTDPPLTEAMLDAVLTTARDRMKRSTTPSKRHDGTYISRVLNADILNDSRELGSAALAVARAAKGITQEQLHARLMPCVGGGLIAELPQAIRSALAYADSRRAMAAGEHEFKQNEKTGTPDAGDQGNLDIAFGRLGVTFSYDLLAERKMITYGPGRDAPGRAPHTEVIQDKHMDRLWLDVDEKYKFRPTKEFFLVVVSDRARQNEFHPVLNYLDNLPPHDGESRIDTWLIRLCGAKDTPFVRAVSRLILVAAVRRVRSPGCKFDEMLILESITQGTDKTSFVRALCPNADWFGSRLPLHADVKTRMEATAGKWIIEAGELSGMGQADHRGLKDYLSTQTDEARMAYGRETTRRDRQFIVIGTTNDKQYLKDYLNRRYWPVEISRCNVEGLMAEREQLWAEAAAAEATGESIRLAEQLWADAAAEQEARRIMDPFEAVLMGALDEVTGIIALEDVWKLCGLEKRPSMSESQRINEIMTVKLRWVAGRKRRNGRKTVCFCKAPADAVAMTGAEVAGARVDAEVWVSVKPSADGWQCVAGPTPGPGPGGTVIPIGAARA